MLVQFHDAAVEPLWSGLNLAVENGDKLAAFDGVADYRVHSKPLGQWRLFERLSQEKIVICRAESSS